MVSALSGLAVFLTGCGADDGVFRVDASTLSREHAEGNLGYDLTKSVPVGGKHNPKWAACKMWFTPVATEYLIHSMEHGAVWIAYETTISDADVMRFNDIAEINPYVVVTPHVKLPAPIVISAWGLQITAATSIEPKIADFIDKYANGPQTPEPGAPCKEGGITSSAEAAVVTGGKSPNSVDTKEEADQA